MPGYLHKLDYAPPEPRPPVAPWIDRLLSWLGLTALILLILLLFVRQFVWWWFFGAISQGTNF